MSKQMLVAVFTLLVVMLIVGDVTAQVVPAAKSVSPELINTLTKELSITPEQATGGSGALFGLAKSTLKPKEFAKIAKAVPDMDGLLRAAPGPATAATDPISSIVSALPGNIGGMASMIGSFKTLGLSPDMIGKFVPILNKYVGSKGGSNVAGLLGGVLK